MEHTATTTSINDYSGFHPINNNNTVEGNNNDTNDYQQQQQQNVWLLLLRPLFCRMRHQQKQELKKQQQQQPDATTGNHNKNYLLLFSRRSKKNGIINTSTTLNTTNDMIVPSSSSLPSSPDSAAFINFYYDDDDDYNDVDVGNTSKVLFPFWATNTAANKTENEEIVEEVVVVVDEKSDVVQQKYLNLSSSGSINSISQKISPKNISNINSTDNQLQQLDSTSSGYVVISQQSTNSSNNSVVNSLSVSKLYIDESASHRKDPSSSNSITESIPNVKNRSDDDGSGSGNSDSKKLSLVSFRKKTKKMFRCTTLLLGHSNNNHKNKNRISGNTAPHNNKRKGKNTKTNYHRRRNHNRLNSFGNDDIISTQSNVDTILRKNFKRENNNSDNNGYHNSDNNSDNCSYNFSISGDRESSAFHLVSNITPTNIYTDNIDATITSKFEKNNQAMEYNNNSIIQQFNFDSSDTNSCAAPRPMIATTTAVAPTDLVLFQNNDTVPKHPSFQVTQDASINNEPDDTSLLDLMSEPYQNVEEERPVKIHITTQDYDMRKPRKSNADNKDEDHDDDDHTSTRLKNLINENNCPNNDDQKGTDFNFSDHHGPIITLHEFMNGNVQRKSNRNMRVGYSNNTNISSLSPKLSDLSATTDSGRVGCGADDQNVGDDDNFLGFPFGDDDDYPQVVLREVSNLCDIVTDHAAAIIDYEDEFFKTLSLMHDNFYNDPGVQQSNYYQQQRKLRATEQQQRQRVGMRLGIDYNAANGKSLPIHASSSSDSEDVSNRASTENDYMDWLNKKIDLMLDQVEQEDSYYYEESQMDGTNRVSTNNSIHTGSSSGWEERDDAANWSKDSGNEGAIDNNGGITDFSNILQQDPFEPILKPICRMIVATKLPPPPLPPSRRKLKVQEQRHRRKLNSTRSFPPPKLTMMMMTTTTTKSTTKKVKKYEA